MDEKTCGEILRQLEQIANSLKQIEEELLKHHDIGIKAFTELLRLCREIDREVGHSAGWMQGRF